MKDGKELRWAVTTPVTDVERRLMQRDLVGNGSHAARAASNRLRRPLILPEAMMRQGTERLPDKIDEMVQRIVDRFDPDQIILFGSHARGTADADSDVDLLVVMPVTGSKREKQIEVRCALHDIHVAKDIIVVTPDEVERRRNIVGTIIRSALREGEVLYVTARLQAAAAGTIPRPTSSRPADHYNRMIRWPCCLRLMTSGT